MSHGQKSKKKEGKEKKAIHQEGEEGIQREGTAKEKIRVKESRSNNIRKERERGRQKEQSIGQ